MKADVLVMDSLLLGLNMLIGIDIIEILGEVSGSQSGKGNCKECQSIYPPRTR